MKKKENTRKIKREKNMFFFFLQFYLFLSKEELTTRILGN